MSDLEIAKVNFYDDESNMIIWEPCKDGISFKDSQAVLSMYEHCKIPNCRRIEIVWHEYLGMGHYVGKTELFYKFRGMWVPLKDVEIKALGFDLNKYFIFWYDETDENDVQLEEDTPLSQELLFWKYREKLRCILADMDPVEITRFPHMRDDMTAYAKESYKMVERIRNMTDEIQVRNAIRTVLYELDSVLLSDEQVKLIVDWMLSDLKFHTCPVCKKHYFRDEGEKCLVCGWINTPLAEGEYYRIEYVSVKNRESLEMRQLYYYLTSIGNTKDVAITIWNKYMELFEALIKVKIHFAKEDNSHGVIFRDVNIEDKEFKELRESIVSELYTLYVEKVLGVDFNNTLFGPICGSIRKNDHERLNSLLELAKSDDDYADIPLSYLHEKGFISRDLFYLLDEMDVDTLGEVCEVDCEKLEYSGCREFESVYKVFGMNTDIFREYIHTHMPNDG